jgi:hypothetical protein
MAKRIKDGQTTFYKTIHRKHKRWSNTNPGKTVLTPTFTFLSSPFDGLVYKSFILVTISLSFC